MPQTEPKRIGIAVVEHRGRYLVGTRGPDGPLAGYAEFPGGKCRVNESPEACASRECMEETGLRILVERLLLRVDHTYPHGAVALHFFLCHPEDVSSVRDDYRGFRWIKAGHLKQLKFPEANASLVETLSAEETDMA